MGRYELLDNVAHADLRVVTRFGAAYGDAVATVPAFPTEYAELQREYPIFFHRHPDGGGFGSVALLGFEAGENLFLDGERWDATYLPGHVAKGPFLIGFREQWIDGSLRDEPVLHVDLDHPRAGADDGDGTPVFLPGGGHGPHLQRVITVLRGIHAGVEGGRAMYAAFEAAGLIQPVDLDLRFDDDAGASLTGLYGIDRDRLAALDAATLHALHRAGFLEGAYLQLASLHNIRHLMARKRHRLQHRDGASIMRGHAGTR